MNFAEREIKNEIMATDIRVSLTDTSISKREMERDLDHAFTLFREFENNYSRFKSNNQLSTFNNSLGEINVSAELLDMLVLSKAYFNKTSGVFDICVLPALISEGYDVSKNQGFIANHKLELDDNAHTYTSADLLINGERVSKPLDLKTDLGGIGKGYIVQKVANFLKQKYANFIVDAGGDMYVSGIDLKNNYDYWAIDVENPTKSFDSVATLMVSNNGIATSGVNKRHWKHANDDKNHIIDMKTHHSLKTDLQTVTIVSANAIDADVYAKTILVLGLNAGMEFANANSIATLIIDKNLQLFKSKEMEKYVWKN